jgi:hypothetical protein
MTIFTGQSFNGWWKVYGIWTGRIFIGLSITPKKVEPELDGEEPTNE